MHAPAQPRAALLGGPSGCTSASALQAFISRSCIRALLTAAPAQVRGCWPVPTTAWSWWRAQRQMTSRHASWHAPRLRCCVTRCRQPGAARQQGTRSPRRRPGRRRCPLARWEPLPPALEPPCSCLSSCSRQRSGRPVRLRLCCLLWGWACSSFTWTLPGGHARPAAAGPAAAREAPVPAGTAAALTCCARLLARRPRRRQRAQRA